MKKIAIITSSRADYGPLHNLISNYETKREFDYRLVVCGTHLSKHHGLTINEIFKDKFKIGYKFNSISNDATNDINLSVSRCIKEFSNYFLLFNPNLVIVTGDRFEQFASAIAAFFLKIPIAHISGGELTYGAFDDTLRHSITKLSTIHLVATDVYRRRVIQLGENPSTVHNVGGLGVDNIKQFKQVTKNYLSKKYKISFEKKIIVVTFHPETNEKKDNFKKLNILLNFCKKLDQFQILLTAPNIDQDKHKILRHIVNYCSHASNMYFVNSFGRQDYFSILKNSYLVIGNSSSGILEVPSFKIPTINIGNRQEGREKAISIIDCEFSIKSLNNAFQLSTNNSFRNKLKNTRNLNPYGNGGSAIKIYRLIKKLTYKKSPIIKMKFFNV